MPFVQKEELGKPSHIVRTLKLFVIMRAGLPKAKAGGASLLAVGKKKTQEMDFVDLFQGSK